MTKTICLHPKIEQSILKWFDNRTTPAIFLVGPPGVGKTTLAYRVMEERSLRVKEFNASHTRSGANFRKSTGERVAYHNEVPTDISQLSDRTGMIPAISQETINIDGGGAYAMFETALRADGGFSGSRWGAASTVFDGGATAGTTVFELALNGGGA